MTTIDTANIETTGHATLDENTHTLDTPIEREGQTITQVTLRKPTSGALRGTSLAALVNLDVDALRKVLPRISAPTLTEFDVASMDPADLVALGGIFAGFLMPKALKASMEFPNAQRMPWPISRPCLAGRRAIWTALLWPN